MTMVAPPGRAVANGHLERHCDCLQGAKRIPLWRFPLTAALLVDKVHGLAGLARVEVLMYRCPACGRAVILTLGDLLGEGLSAA